MLSLQLSLFLGFVQQLLDVKDLKQLTCAYGWALTHVLHKGQASFGLKAFWDRDIHKLVSQSGISEEGKRAFSHRNYTAFSYLKVSNVDT